jgi:hypothetical protein
VQVMLGVGLPSREGGIADRGQPYNASDVVLTGDTRPERRFALGLLNGDSVVVAIEHGGVGTWVQTVELKQSGTTWEIGRCAVTYKVPGHGTQLTEALATQPRWDWMACGMPGAERPAGMPAAMRAPPIPSEHR